MKREKVSYCIWNLILGSIKYEACRTSRLNIYTLNFNKTKITFIYNFTPFPPSCCYFVLSTFLFSRFFIQECYFCYKKIGYFLYRFQRNFFVFVFKEYSLCYKYISNLKLLKVFTKFQRHTCNNTFSSRKFIYFSIKAHLNIKTTVWHRFYFFK